MIWIREQLEVTGYTIEKIILSEYLSMCSAYYYLQVNVSILMAKDPSFFQKLGSQYIQIIQLWQIYFKFSMGIVIWGGREQITWCAIDHATDSPKDINE